MNDNVNHPAHYADSCSIECIDAMLVAFGFDYVYNYCLINAFKYIWRHKNKNGLEDIKKAEWYINKACDMCEHLFNEPPDKSDGKYVMLKDLMQKAMNEYIEKELGVNKKRSSET